MHKEYLSITYVKKDIQDIPSKISYTVILSNGLVFITTFSDNRTFRIRVAIDDPSEQEKNNLPKLSQVELEGNVIGSQFHLILVQNENEITKKTGVASMMMKILLTFIADYNATNHDEITRIIGTMVTIGSSSYEELRKFYLAQNHLSDHANRIQVIIDAAECENYNILYHIQNN